MLLLLRPVFLLLVLLFANSSLAQEAISTLTDKEQFEDILLRIDDISGKDIREGKTLIAKAIDLAIQHNWKDKEIRAKIKLAKMEYLSGDYEQSSKLDHEILDYYEANNDLAKAGNQLNFMALSQSRIGKYKEAIRYLEQALVNCSAANDSACISVSYDHKGVIFMRLENPKKAMAPFFTCLQIRKKIKDTLGLGYIYDNLSWAYTEQKQYDRALEMAQKAMTIRDLLGIETDIAVNINNIGEIYFAKKDFKKAILFFEKSLKKSLNIGFTDLSRHTYEFLSKAHSQLGDFEKAHHSLKNSYALKDSLSNVERTKSILELETRYATERKQRIIQVQQLEIEKEKERNKNIIILALSGLVFLSLLSLFAFTYTKVKQREKKRKEELKYRQKLMEAIIETTDKERKRIARDLHDGIGQQLSGLKMAWQRFSKKISKGEQMPAETINDLSKILDEASNDLRNISHQMMPKTLSEFGLVDAIDDMIQKSFSSADIQYTFDTFGISKRFEEKIEIAVFRITQELVNNILKHSGADEVGIQLYQTKEHLILSLEDNGSSFQPTNYNKDGLGMMNMISRAKVIQAELHFDKNQGGGLISTLRIPIT